jgi:hypothetical protein
VLFTTLLAGVLAACTASEPPARTTTVSPPTTSPGPDMGPQSEDCDARVPDGDDLGAAIESHPEGTSFCLTGIYRLSSPLRPKDGQSFIGPAEIVGADGNEAGFILADERGRDVTFRFLDMSGFALRAIDCAVGTVVRDSFIHDNGRNGLGCGLNGEGGVVIEGNEIAGNGSPEHLGSGSAGMKFARGHGVIVRDNHIHDNLGNGVWCDVQCGDLLVEGNLIERNSRKGVHYEKSGASDEVVEFVGEAIIRDNVVTGNGWEGRKHAADGGIVCVSCMNMTIEGNSTSDNGRAGVVIRQDGRVTGEKHGWQIANVVIRGNDLADGAEGCELPGVTCSFGP